MASVNVRIRPEGGREVRAALLGIVRDSAKARALIKSQAQASARAEAAAAREAASARTTAERQSLRDVGNALRQSFRILRDVERDKRREIEQTAAARKAAEEKAAREAVRRRREETSTGRSRAGLALGAIGTVAGIASSQITRAQGALGIQSTEQVYASIQDARLGFLRQSVQAGQSREQRTASEAELRNIARATDVPLADLYGAAAASQGRFSNLDDFLAQLGELARISQAYGSSLVDLQGVTGELNRQFGLSGEASVEATYAIMNAAQAGSMEASDFSQNFAQAMGQYSMSRGGRGRGQAAVMDFAAAAQVIASGGVGGEQARTQMQNLMNQLSDRKVQRRLRRAGVEVLDENGMMRSFSDIARQGAASADLRDPTKLRTILPEAWAARALTTLISREGTDKSVSAIARSTAAGGRANVDRFFTEFRADPLAADAAARTGREVGIAEQIPELSASFHTMADGATQLGTKFPILAGMTSDLAGAMQSAATTALGFGATQGTLASVGISGAAAVAALGRFGPAVAAAGTALRWLGGIGVAAAAGWGVGRLIANATDSDEKLGDAAWYMFGRSRRAENFHDTIRDGWRSLTGTERGGAPGTQRVAGTVELGPSSLAVIRSGAPEPGEGRRQPGGAERRP